MTRKELILAAVNHPPVGKIPTDMWATPEVQETLYGHFDITVGKSTQIDTIGKKSMLRTILMCICLFGIVPFSNAKELSNPLKLWYRQPADRWMEALPVGNGRVGAMVFGCVTEERIALNETTFWSGAPSEEHDNPEARESFLQARDLFKLGKHSDAEPLIGKILGRQLNYGTNLPAGDLLFTQRGVDGKVSEYIRELDLDKAVATVSFNYEGIHFRREILASYPDQVLAIRLTADRGKAISFSLGGPMKGIPYDGHMTKEDGKGKWWEGLDPADLYGLPPEKRTPEWIEGMKKNWVLRHKELAIKYDVDFLWFDGYGFPYGEYGKEVCAAYFNHKLNKYGKINGIVAGKFSNEPSTVKDIERGGANEILPVPWQSITTFTHWFYKEDESPRHNARTVIEMLTDVISKNGNFLLNVELMGDGTIPEEHKLILDEIGRWVNLNKDAIYASKPWKIYGDNLFSYLKREEGDGNVTDLEALEKQKQSEQFNERTIESEPYGHDEVRFATKNDTLYIFVLNPKKGIIEIPSLALNSQFSTKRIKSIKLIGGKSKVDFMQDEERLNLIVPEERPNQYVAVFEVAGVL